MKSIHLLMSYYVIYHNIIIYIFSSQVCPDSEYHSLIYLSVNLCSVEYQHFWPISVWLKVSFKTAGTALLFKESNFYRTSLLLTHVSVIASVVCVCVSIKILLYSQ